MAFGAYVDIDPCLKQISKSEQSNENKVGPLFFAVMINEAARPMMGVVAAKGLSPDHAMMNRAMTMARRQCCLLHDVDDAIVPMPDFACCLLKRA